MEEKNCLVFDTNFILKNPKLDEVVENLKEEFTVYISQVSIDERIFQECRKLKRKFEDIDSISKKYSGIISVELKTTFEKEAVKYQKGMQKKYELLFGENIIPFTKSTDMFETVLKRANYKQVPFSPDESASDKGFKDTLIWLSLLNYFKDNGSSRVVFITDDQGFRKNIHILEEEFSETTGKQLSIRDNSYYGEILKKSLLPIEPIQDFIPDIEELRRKITHCVNSICSEFVEEYGDRRYMLTFTTSEKFDSQYIESFFSNLQGILSDHILSEEISASHLFTIDNRVKDGVADISIKKIEELKKIYDDIRINYNNYLSPFFSRVADILNCNYRDPSQYDDDLPW